MGCDIHQVFEKRDANGVWHTWPDRPGEDICGVLLTGPNEEPPSQLCGYVRGHIGPHAGRV